jgi:N-acetylmuramoyl-L-alanine amidase
LICKKLKILSFIFILFAFLGVLSASTSGKGDIDVITLDKREYVSLYDFIKLFSVDNSFDVVTGRGKLYNKSDVSVYQIGFSVILVNGALEKSEYPVIRRRGEILFPTGLFESLFIHFYPHVKIKRENKRYTFYEEGIETGIDRFTARDRKPFVNRKDSDRIGFIIIDPGHGGKDPGAIGKGRLREKFITLNVARFLSSFVKKKLKNVKVVLTRGSDRFVELGKRTEIANKMLKNNVNGIFVSIHANASISRRISGFETYFLSQNPTNEDARTTAALENNVVILENSSRRKSYNDVDLIEALMITTQIQKESSLLAQHIQKGMDKRISEFKSRGVKKADFFVLRGALMPAVLVEMGYMSNRRELGYLKRTGYQRKIAEGIGTGIIEFIKKYDKMIKNK